MKIGTGRNAKLWVGLLCVVTQFALVATSFPLHELGSDTPILHFDTGYHWYEIWFAEHIARDGLVIGYDPTFSAGMINGFNLNQSAKVPALLGIASHIGPGEAYKWFAFVTAVLSPLAIVAAAGLMGASTPIMGLTAVFSLILWWATDLRAYYSAGMASWAGTCCVVPLLSLLIVRYASTASSGRILTLIGLAIGAAALTFYHPLAPIPVAATVLAIALADWSNINRRRAFAVVVCVSVIALAANFWWLSLALRYPVSAKGLVLPDPALAVASLDQLWRPMLGVNAVWPHGSKWYLVLVLLAPLSFLAPRSEFRRGLIAFVLLSAAFLIISAGGGSFKALASVQPNRLGAYAFALLTIPAAAGVIEAARHRGIAHMQGTTRVIRGLFCLLVAIPILVFVNEIRREVSSRPIGHYGATPPEVNGPGPTARDFRAWLAMNTDADSRILFEQTSGSRLDAVVMAGYLSVDSGREFIGGPYPSWGFVDFYDGILFGQEVGTLSPARFAALATLYNIRWVAAWSRRSLAYLDRMEDAKKVADVGQLQIYELGSASPSYFLRGEGRIVERGPNKLILDDLRGADVIIKYHFVPELSATAPAIIEGVAVEGATMPFVRLRNPPSRVEIRMR